MNDSLTFSDVEQAYERIKKYINKTPLITNKSINRQLNANIFFKLENLQKTGSFKLRGATNNLLHYFEEYRKFPDKIVTASSGNHAIAICHLSQEFKIQNTRIYIDQNVSKVKITKIKSYQEQYPNIELVVTKNKKETNEKAMESQNKEGYYLCSSYDHNDVISGQGTACLESLNEININIDAIFTPCGGGGLISGTYLMATKLNPIPYIAAVEPENANDAMISKKTGKIFQHKETPNTIADGARTLSLSEKTFHYIKKIDNIYSATEEEIKLWQQKLIDNLNTNIEPTCALSIIGVVKFLKDNSDKKNILVILSGGNC